MLLDNQPYNLQNMQEGKYWRILLEGNLPHDQSNVSLSLHRVTGYFADEYILPATTDGPIYTILSDESTFKGHAGISAVLMPNEKPDDEAVVSREQSLGNLCNEFKLNNIHFTDIFGHNLLKERRRSFLDRYIEIVNGKSMHAVSFAMSRAGLQQQAALSTASDPDLYFILFWNAMEQIVKLLPQRSIFHIWFEQENNVTTDLVETYVSKLYNGIRYCESFKVKETSICKHPFFFSKKALLYSSLADLVAYSNNILQAKLDQNIPLTKIKKNHAELIETLRFVFGNDGYLSMQQSGRGVAQLINGEI